MCDNIGVSGVAPSVYIVADDRIRDIFLNVGGNTCTYPIPDAGIIYVGATDQKFFFQFSGEGADYDGVTPIDKINVTFYGKLAFNNTIRIYYKTAGIKYYITTLRSEIFPADLTQYGNASGTEAWFTNPSTGLPWTLAQILAGEFGFETNATFELRGAFIQIYWGGIGDGSAGSSGDHATVIIQDAATPAPCGQTATLPNAFTLYESAITNITPPFGVLAGGTQVIIEGFNFIAGSTITFGGVAATDVTFIDDQHFTCVTPNHAIGYVDVVITEPSGAQLTAPNGFQYTFLTRGSDIRRMPSIQIRDVLNNTPNTCAFTVDGQSNAPTVGEEIRIIDDHDGNRLLFAGNVQRVEQVYEELTDQLAWNVTCIDFTWLLNRRRPYGNYVLVSVSDIVKDLVARFAPGFTSNHVQTNLARVSIMFDGSEDFQTCLTTLANAIGGGHWYVDYNQDVHFFHVVPSDIKLPDQPESTLRLGPGTAMTVAEGALIPSAFSYTPGYYIFQSTFVYDNGVESALSPASAPIACATGKKQLTFTGLPIGAAAGVHTVIARRVYSTYIGTIAGGTAGLRSRARFCEVKNNTTANFTTWFAGTGSADPDVHPALQGNPPIPYVTPPAYVPSAVSAALTASASAALAYVPPGSDLWDGNQVAYPFSPGTYSFKIANVYQDMTESQLGPASNLITIVGSSTIEGRDTTIEAPGQATMTNVTGVGNIAVPTYCYVAAVKNGLIGALSNIATLDVGTVGIIPHATRILWNRTVLTVDSYIVWHFDNSAFHPFTNPNVGNVRVHRHDLTHDGGAFDYTALFTTLIDGDTWTPPVASPVQAHMVTLNNVPVGLPVNGVPVIARRVYASAGGTWTPDSAVSWYFIKDNTTTDLDVSPGIAPTDVPTNISDPSAPIWPNPDGPDLEDDALPGDIDLLDTYLLRDPPFRSDIDLSQVRNRVCLRGAGSSLVAAVPIGSTTFPVTEVGFFSPTGGKIYIDGYVLNYSGISTGKGPGSLYLTVPTLVAFTQGQGVNLYLQVDDTASQNALGKVELDKDGRPTDGVHEYVIVDGTLTSAFQMYMRGFAELELFAWPIVTINYSTRDPNTRSGKIVHVDLAHPPCVGDFLIQDVTIDQIHDDSDDLTPRYNVTASSVKFDMNDLLLQLLTRPGGGGPSQDTSSASLAGVVTAAVQSVPAAAAVTTATRRQWIAFHMGSGPLQATFGIGCAAPTVDGTYFDNPQPEASYARLRSAAWAGVRWSGSPTQIVQARQNPTFAWQIRTDSDFSQTVTWVLASVAEPGLGYDAGGAAIGFRFSNDGTAADVGWRGLVHDGVTQVLTAAIGTVLVDTNYTLRARISGSTAYFSVNDGVEVSLTTNLPPAATELNNWFVRTTSTIGLTRGINVSAGYCEYGTNPTLY